MDAATIAIVLLDDQPHGPAILLHREGSRLGAVMAAIFKLREPPVEPPTRLEIATLRRCLEDGGYPVRAGADLAAFAELSADYVGRLNALADHLGAQGVTLFPPGRDPETQPIEAKAD